MVSYYHGRLVSCPAVTIVIPKPIIIREGFQVARLRVNGCNQEFQPSSPARDNTYAYAVERCVGEEIRGEIKLFISPGMTTTSDRQTIGRAEGRISDNADDNDVVLYTCIRVCVCVCVCLCTGTIL